MQYLRREHIDTAKWDACIEKSANGLLYGYSFYLDKMARNWSALVIGDYEVIMPLIWNRKYGIKYLYQPVFTQQLGIFSSQRITEQLIELFLKQLQQRFRFAEIFVNYSNRHSTFIHRRNYVLSLKDDYVAISNNYKSDLKKNLKKALQARPAYRQLENINVVIELYRNTYNERFPHVKNEDYTRFEELCSLLNKKGWLILRGAFDSENGLLAVVLLLKGKNRLHLMQAVTPPEKRKFSGMHFLLDNVIKEFSGIDVLLDFEGSSIPGVADFYSNFGATEEQYFFYRYNRLPWPLRLFK